MVELSQHELMKVNDRGSGEDFINSGCGDVTNNKRIIRNLVYIGALPDFKPINFEDRTGS